MVLISYAELDEAYSTVRQSACESQGCTIMILVANDVSKLRSIYYSLSLTYATWYVRAGGRDGGDEDSDPFAAPGQHSVQDAARGDAIAPQGRRGGVWSAWN